MLSSNCVPTAKSVFFLDIVELFAPGGNKKYKCDRFFLVCCLELIISFPKVSESTLKNLRRTAGLGDVLQATGFVERMKNRHLTKIKDTFNQEEECEGILFHCTDVQIIKKYGTIHFSSKLIQSKVFLLSQTKRHFTNNRDFIFSKGILRDFWRINQKSYLTN